MSRSLDKILFELEQVAQGHSSGLASTIDPRARTLVAIIFLFGLLSISLNDIGRIAIWALPLIFLALLCRVNYLSLLSRSLIVLPFVALIGLFDILHEREVVATLLGIRITQGWIMALAIMLRAIISVQTILLLILSTGINPICRALQGLGLPSLFVLQLMMVYRFLIIMIRQLQELMRAADSRSAAKSHYPLSLWAHLVGELLLRAVGRAKVINQAMKARLWDGRVPIFNDKSRWRWRETIFMILSITGIALMRYINLK